jgi:hypothetical protein
MFRVLVPVLALGLTLTAVAVAGGATASKAPKTATVRADGKLQFKVNKFFKEGYHYQKGKVVIRSGGTLKIADKTGEDHTFSLVAKKDAPKTIKQVGACFEGGACAKVFEAHGFTDNGPPANPVVNVGAPGLDVAGDSLLLAAKSKNTTVNVSAKAGSRLHFMCAIHPEMQGDIIVKK